MMCKVLIFSCISAVMLTTAAYGATISPAQENLIEAAIKDLECLEKIKDKIHIDLYTPNDKRECSRQTLQCYLEEMSPLEEEMRPLEKETEEENHSHLQNIIKNLQNLTVLIPPGTGCKMCEANMKKFPEFHEELKKFLQSMLK